MAAIGTISSGHDPEYYTQASKGPEYYSAAAGKAGMEPEGTWTGAGCPELGLTIGAAVDPAVFVPLFGEFRDPRDGTRLGRAMSRYADWRAGYAEALAMEPEATAERRAELKDQAKAQVRQAVQYFDVTFSPSKDITLLHASFMANVAAAVDRGSEGDAGYWQAAADDVWACVSEGSQAMIDYLQDHAGYTRSGYHSENSGRWEDAHDWVVASFRQHTSRSGDPQMHVHNTILNRVRRESDGARRTLDGRAIYRERAAASAQGALVMENALSNRLGVEWGQRKDGHGREIKGVPQQAMDEFSTRTRQEIEPLLVGLVAAFKAQHGFEPDARALGSLRLRANKLSRASKGESDPGELMDHVRDWAAQARAADGQALEPLGPAVSNRKGPGSAQAQAEPGLPRPVLTPGQAHRLMTGALELVQAAQSTWTRSALHRALGEMLPAYTGPMSSAEAAALLPGLTDRVLAGEAGAVVRLSVPEWPAVPASLRRKNGESVFAPHQAEMYATEAQIGMEERILAVAARRSSGVPRVEPELAAQLLGSDAAQLEAQLSRDAGADVVTETGSGLHLDQAAAAYRLLTSDRRAEVMVGPAGTGKTRTVGVMADAWRQAHPGTRVVGLSATQQAANVIKLAGLADSHNIAMFLTKRSLQDGLAGALIVIDEGSMVEMPHYDAVLAIAAAAGAKVAVTGDPAQLGAVGAAGGMMMLARQQGSVQLGEPMRFREEWQREASLRLRAGDVSVLTEYDQQARLRYGTKEEMAEEAYQWWLADYVNGKHSALIAHDQGDADEMSRRARADLKRYGRVASGGEVELRNGASASAGDRIMARDNDHKLSPGVAGRGLSNRDVLEVLRTDAGLSGRAVEVRLRLGRDAAGAETWGAPFLLARRYLSEQCHLAYGLTIHSVEGATFDDNGYCLIRASDDRKTLYTGLSRARGRNIAFVAGEGRAKDAQDATTRRAERPAEADPEIARAQALAAERAGKLAGGAQADLDGDAVTVLAQVVRRDDPNLAAVEALRKALSDADHLADFGHRWMELAKQESAARFSQVLQDRLPAHLADSAMDDAALTWLYRDLRAAELAGRDGGAVLAEAIEMRPMTGARDVARVLHGRVQILMKGAEPRVGRSWAERVPEVADPEMARYMTELAGAIDARVARLGEHAAQAEPLWATRTFGPVPEDLAARADWERRASAVAAYREMHGYENPGDPIGPEPSRVSPEAAADWHAALAALGAVDGMDLLGVPDEALEVRSALYEQETAWAPEHVGDQLRLARQTVTEAESRSARAEHQRLAAKDEAARAQLAANRKIWEDMRAKAVAERSDYEKADAARREWARVTEDTRRIALAADLELQRRHPEAGRERIRSAEPPTQMERIRAQGRAAPEDVQQVLPGLPEPEREAEVMTSRQEDEQLRAELGLTPETVADPLPEHALRAAANARETEEILAALRSMPEPAEAEEELSPGEAWAVEAGRQRDSVLQPSVTLVSPAPQVTALQPGIEREASS
jgi:TrwC relaxase/AAA domain